MAGSRVAFITGAGRGQGRAHALRLAAAGYDIAAVDLCADLPSIPYPLATADDLAGTVAAVEATGRRALGLTADVRDPAVMEQAAAETAAVLGSIDAVVANAGVFAAAHTWETDPGVWGALLAVNLTGAWATARATVPHLLDREGGAVVFVASIAGLKGIEHLGAYAASKHGVIGLMRSLALELAPHGVRVNAVCPTNVGTGILHNEHTYSLFLPEGERDEASLLAAFASVNKIPVPWIEPEDVAAAVAWLVSDQARFVTGTVLPVDAGALLH